MTAHVMPGGAEMNPCCASWKEKCSKTTKSRNALREAVTILNQQYEKLKAESLEVEKALAEERARADKEKAEKLKELSVKVSLENEISALKSEITLAQQKEQSGVQGTQNEEVRDLQSRVSDMEAEIKRLKKLLDQEKLRADSEKKKVASEKSRAAEAWKLVNAEKSKLEEERRLVDIERKKADECRIQLESIKKEEDETRSKLVAETLKSKEASKKLESEKKKTIKEKKRADSERLKADEQRNLVDEIRRNVVEEKTRADRLSRQLEEANLEIKELQKARQELLCSLRLAESGNCLQPEMAKSDSVKSKYLQPEDVNQLTEVVKNKKALEFQVMVDEPKKFLRVHGKKAMKRKYIDQLAHFGVDAETIEKLHKDAHVFEASRRSMQTLANVVDKITKDESERMSILKEQLKLAKMQVKHAKEVAKLEKSHNHILRQEICHLKQDFFLFSHRFGLQDGHFPCCSEGIDDITKTCRLFAEYLERSL